MSGAYGASAKAYFDAGWSPVPFPAFQKFPPVDNYTGANGNWVDELTLRRWLNPKTGVTAGNMGWLAASGNIGLRLPATVLGIDVDMYDGKDGRKTWEKANAEWGVLPPTWYPSSRIDGSGIRLYRIPEGLAWPGKLPQGGGVELIRWDHRYAIVGPSIHPDTRLPYLWFVEDPALTSGAITGGVSEPWGYVAEEEFPNIGDLPELPSSWIEGLTSGKKWTERAAADMDPEDVKLWISDRAGPELCAVMTSTLKQWSLKLRKAGDDGGSHDAARDAVWSLLGDAHAGHSGISKALARLKKTFLPAVERRSGPRLASEEWARIVVRGVQKVAAEGEPNGADLCGLISGGSNSKDSLQSSDSGSSGSKHLAFARTDSGNAERLTLAYRHEQKYVEGSGWLVWSPEEERWVKDFDGAVNRRAIEVARAIGGEAEFLAEEDPKEFAELKKFARASENISRIRAMVDLSASLSGMTLPATAFDADPLRLGRVVLGLSPEASASIKVGPALPEHRVTMRLGAAYKSGADYGAWNRFLARAQPDPEVLDWVHRLVGYSLQGGNPDRLFIANFGVSSTGKTTFMEAIRAALGDYTAVVNMTIYRDNQDDKPRPDLIRALNRRIAFSEETSSAWHLHADQVKRITGGAPITARGMRSDNFHEVVPAFTPWLFVNAPPTIEGADTALRRRLVVAPWDVVIPKEEEDSNLRDRLKGDRARSAVLAWALGGWEAYRANPDLSAPVGALYARERFLSEMSDLDRAINEICVVEEGACERPAVLFQAYSHWCATEKVKQESNTKFGTFLSGRGFDRLRKRVDGVPIWVRSGLRLSEEFSRLFGG